MEEPQHFGDLGERLGGAIKASEKLGLTTGTRRSESATTAACAGSSPPRGGGERATADEVEGGGVGAVSGHRVAVVRGRTTGIRDRAFGHPATTLGNQ
ncbi:MAG: hypothetical protein ACHREM_31395 [Polyangiales bacterium]